MGAGEGEWKTDNLDNIPEYKGETRKLLWWVKSGASEKKSERKRKMALEKVRNEIEYGEGNKREEIAPTERQVQIFDKAKDYVNKLREELGMPIIDKNEMEMVIVAKQSDDKHDGYYCLSSGRVVIFNDGSDLWMAEKMVHELIHKYIDIHIGLTKPHYIELTKRNYWGMKYPRNGLRIDKSEVVNGERIPIKSEIGDMLNELPNYYFQARFARECLKGKDPFWNEERIRYKRFLANMKWEDDDWKKRVITSVTGKEYKIRMSAEYSLPYKKDKTELDVKFGMSKSYIELADSLNLAVGKVGNNSLMMALLEAKSDPRKQQEIAAAVDMKMGKGFYRRLKNMKYEDGDDFLQLLVDVQAKAIEENHKNIEAGKSGLVKFWDKLRQMWK
jgi:hypothetical protein